MEVSSQPHASAALPPLKGRPVHTEQNDIRPQNLYTDHTANVNIETVGGIGTVASHRSLQQTDCFQIS